MRAGGFCVNDSFVKYLRISFLLRGFHVYRVKRGERLVAVCCVFQKEDSTEDDYGNNGIHVEKPAVFFSML